MPLNTGRSLAKANALLELHVPAMQERIARFTVLTGELDAAFTRLFFHYLDENLPLFKVAAARDDLGALMKLAHAGKGVGGGVGFPEVSALCEYLEEVCRDGHCEKARALVVVWVEWANLARESS